jgi:2-amino-4-hydroxy-6-hydroxymethyldihydropteridine diphosphokinase
VNSVVEIQTTLDPNELLKALQKIEITMGRKKTETAKPVGKKDAGKKGDKDKAVSRVIDLDIIFYAREIVDERKLKIPHPELANRKFVLLPLSELTPAYVHPTGGQTVSQMLVGCKDDKKIHLFKN